METLSSGKKQTRKTKKIERDYVNNVYFGNRFDNTTWALSNMAPCRFEFNDRFYASAERCYHAEKLRHAARYVEANKTEVRDRLHQAARIVQKFRGSRQAKKVAKECESIFPGNFVSDWGGQLGLDVMESILMAKFEGPTHACMKARDILLGSGDKGLVQIANGCGRWGMASDLKSGRNELGLLLQKVRERLRERGWKIGMAKLPLGGSVLRHSHVECHN